MPQNSSSDSGAAQAKPLVLLILWGSILVSNFVYALVLFLLAPGVKQPPSPNLFSMPGWAVVASLSAATIAARPFVLASMRNRSRPDDPPDLFFQLLQNRTIVGAAFYEAIAAYSVVGCLAFGCTLAQALVFIALAFVLLMTMLPGILKGIGEYNRMLRGEPEPGGGHLGGKA